ncbi:MAG TPA: M20/M25/M40 family metallo-hydrolase [Gemmatimonadales bacterium]|nr:M20/M25/M40 family metallo-hydrolase [Gemmatimonadales bacterium]
MNSPETPHRWVAEALVLVACCVGLACGRPAGGAPPPATAGQSKQDSRHPAAPEGIPEARVRAELTALADDSMQGRATGTPGAARAARWLAGRLAGAGIRPAGDSGYYQRVPGAGANVVGLIPGADPVLRGRAVVVAAHYDHLGVGRPVAGDSIYNGADDDASGVVAVLEAARALRAGPPPRRTVVVLFTTGEERGLLGTLAYLEHPVVPLDSTDAELELEMVGRPDSLAGGPGRLWLTGDERSTMGAAFRRAGLPVVPDPRPAEHFFERSDNIAFARRGIPAHTLSSFDLHADYHAPSDEASRIDFAHLTEAARVAARALRVLADGGAPVWEGRD